MSEEPKTTRRVFLQQALGLAAATALGSQVEALAQEQQKPTESVLILSDAQGRQQPMAFDVTAMPELPKDWEWAKAPLTNLLAGFKTIRERERKILGTNATFERYIRDGGMFALSQDGNFAGKEIDGDSTYSRIKLKQSNYPVIAYRAEPLNKIPKNAGFYTAHELGHHFNYLPNVFQNYTAEEVVQAGGNALAHSSHPLFGVAVNMDFLDLRKQGRENESLLTFTQLREGNPATMANQLEREKEFLADAVGVTLSGVNPDFPWNAKFSRDQKPLNSPLVKRYVEDVFLYDVMLRNSPTPANQQKAREMYLKLESPSKVFGDEATARTLLTADDKFAQTGDISDAELAASKAIMNKSLDEFKKQRDAQMAAPRR